MLFISSSFYATALHDGRRHCPCPSTRQYRVALAPPIPPCLHCGDGRFCRVTPQPHRSCGRTAESIGKPYAPGLAVIDTRGDLLPVVGGHLIRPVRGGAPAAPPLEAAAARRQPQRHGPAASGPAASGPARPLRRDYFLGLQGDNGKGLAAVAKLYRLITLADKYEPTHMLRP